MRKFEFMKREEEERKQYFKARWAEVQQTAKQRIEQRKKMEELQKLEKGTQQYNVTVEYVPPVTPFKANPVPEEVKVPLYSEIVEQEKLRKQKIKERAKQLLQVATAPHGLDATEVKKKGTVLRNWFS